MGAFDGYPEGCSGPPDLPDPPSEDSIDEVIDSMFENRDQRLLDFFDSGESDTILLFETLHKYGGLPDIRDPNQLMACEEVTRAYESVIKDFKRKYSDLIEELAEEKEAANRSNFE